MKIMEHLTLVTFSYNTPLVLELMLKSYAKYHQGKQRVLLYENSTNDFTAKLLDDNAVPYMRMPGQTHADSLERMINDCMTRYVLVVDSDILFRKNIEPLFDIFKHSDAAILGEECADRADYKLHKRIHPWFMFIDLMQIRDKDIKFTDWKRIADSDSMGFYKCPPIQARTEGIKYDVGATFYEDIIAAGLKIYNYKCDPKYFKHYEALSWNGMLSSKETQERYRLVLLDFEQDRNAFDKISIKDRYHA
jgi:hypothetical protein